MQGAPPLASLGLNPSGAGSRGEPLARRGACPAGCLLDLAAAVPSGGCACFVASLPPAFSLLSCPPSPAGKGVTKSLFRRGLRPRHPCAEPLAALTEPASAVPRGGMNPSGTCYPCPGGEDHLKRRSSSPPVPPLLGCRHCSRESLSVGFTSNLRFPRRRDGCMAGSISAVNGLTPGCRGRSPRQNKLIVSPFPPGRGSGGWGQKEGGRQGQQAANKASPPPGGANAGRASAAPHPAPCIRKLKISPFPPGRGSWDGGKKEGEGRDDGRQRGQAPAGCRQHPPSRRWLGQAPRRYRISRGKCKIYEKA